MNYTEKLKDPRWQKKRLEVLARDQFTCTLCGDKDTELQIHHSVYFEGREPWEYSDGYLTTLCKHCHSLTEYLKKSERTPVIVTKTKYNNSPYVLVACIYKSYGLNGAAFYWYNGKELYEKEDIKPAYYESVKELIVLSGKL